MTNGGDIVVASPSLNNSQQHYRLEFKNNLLTTESRTNCLLRNLSKPAHHYPIFTQPLSNKRVNDARQVSVTKAALHIATRFQPIICAHCSSSKNDYLTCISVRCDHDISYTPCQDGKCSNTNGQSVDML